MSQAFSLYHDLTAVENVRLYAALYGLSGAEARRRTEWALALGGLGRLEDTLTARLPIGMRQRLALACAPSLIMFILTLVVPLLMALNVVREKETGAIYNIYASTVRASGPRGRACRAGCAW